MDNNRGIFLYISYVSRLVVYPYMEAIRKQRKPITMFYFGYVISFKLLRICKSIQSTTGENRFVRYSVTVHNSITIVVSLIHYTYSQS